MTTLKEQRMLNAHQLGRQDYREGKPMIAPVYVDAAEREAYEAGYLGEQRRSQP